MIRKLCLLVCMLVVVGCTVPVSTSTRPAAYYDLNSSEAATASLFSGDEAVLSDEAIGRILEFDYSPDHALHPPLASGS